MSSYLRLKVVGELKLLNIFLKTTQWQVQMFFSSVSPLRSRSLTIEFYKKNYHLKKRAFTEYRACPIQTPFNPCGTVSWRYHNLHKFWQFTALFLLHKYEPHYFIFISRLNGSEKKHNFWPIPCSEFLMRIIVVPWTFQSIFLLYMLLGEYVLFRVYSCSICY